MRAPPLVTLDDLVAAYARVNDRFFAGLDAMEEAQARHFKDLATYGIAIEKDGETIDPGDFYAAPPPLGASV